MVEMYHSLQLLTIYQTLYIFLGVAAVIGVTTGSIIHITSTILASMLNLVAIPAESGRTAASVRADRENRKLEQAWQSPANKTEQEKWGSDNSMERYTEWVEKGAGQRREGQSVLGNTILEEDDSDGF